MTPRRRSPAKRVFRIATLVVPSWLAWYVAFSAKHTDALAHAVRYALGPLWVLLAGALVLRATAIAVGRRRDEDLPLVDRIDVLTARGSALAWTSAFAVMLAVWLGYASLAMVGLLGTGLFHVAVLHAFVALRGRDPMRARNVTRRFLPQMVTEGDELTEEVVFAGARIPTGFRMFVTGRIGPRWATSRHVLDASLSDGDVVVASDVGPAVRGEHEPEPLELWLEDAFGLCRSPRAFVEGARVVVAPRQRVVEGRAMLRDLGIGPQAARTAARLPTEGCLDLREYKAGDDVRRIHWVRSLASGELVVRMPDEIPPDRPRVRLVLDTFFPEAFALDCDAPQQMLDALVSVWLAVGRSLAESGVRVSLVVAMGQGRDVGAVRHDLSLRDFAAALRLGGRVTWQHEMPASQLLTDEATFVISRGVLTPPPPNGKTRWIVVIPAIEEPVWPFPSDFRHAYPAGSSENRWSTRRRVASERALERTEHARAMIAMRTNVARPPPGSFAALPAADGTIRLEAIR